MKYVSTRGGAPTLDFAGVTLAGLASDGGLYVPESWPQLSRDEIAALAGLSYAETAARILAAAEHHPPPPSRDNKTPWAPRPLSLHRRIHHNQVPSTPVDDRRCHLAKGCRYGGPWSQALGR